MEGARVAVAADLPGVAVLARALRAELSEMRGGELWAAREAPGEPLDPALADAFARDDTCLVVGTIDTAVVGYGLVEVERLRDGRALGRVTELYVEPEARAVGVGEAITAALLEFCAAHGCIGVDAIALPGHRAAKSFFETSGFTARAIVMHRPVGE